MNSYSCFILSFSVAWSLNTHSHAQHRCRIICLLVVVCSVFYSMLQPMTRKRDGYLCVLCSLALIHSVLLSICHRIRLMYTQFFFHDAACVLFVISGIHNIFTHTHARGHIHIYLKTRSKTNNKLDVYVCRYKRVCVCTRC